LRIAVLLDGASNSSIRALLPLSCPPIVNPTSIIQLLVGYPTRNPRSLNTQPNRHDKANRGVQKQRKRIFHAQNPFYAVLID
jgi:hypothetical protein